MRGMAKVIFYVLLSGMTAIGWTMGSGQKATNLSPPQVVIKQEECFSINWGRAPQFEKRCFKIIKYNVYKVNEVLLFRETVNMDGGRLQKTKTNTFSCYLLKMHDVYSELAERWTELPQVSGSNPGPGRFIQRLEGWELNVQVVVEERIFSFGIPDNA
ncbi:hypothetical protein TNCV_2479721 [Trichonephila clavipes]|nr:hypothetical protein TNCV_2479721 [Trichonephila clavipes]